MVPVLAGFGVVVVGLVVFLIVKSRSSDTKPAAAPTAAASAPAADPAVKTEPAAPAPAPEPAKPVVAAPPPKPPPSFAEVIQRIEKATTAEEAAEVARDAERTKDAKLVEQCWTKVLKLDSNHADARAKLGVELLDPMKDLPGFAAIATTPQRVHLKPFRESARGELTKSERDALCADWETAKKEIEARVEKSKTEPFFAEVDQFRIDLEGKKFFGTLEYEMVEVAPYALFVEVKGTREERKKRRDEAAASYTPFLTAYDKKIRSYLVPLAPKPLDRDPLFPVFVFLNFDRYNDYAVADKGEKSPPGVRAHYEPGKKQCFTYSPVLKVGYGAFAEGTQSLLHELTHAWVDRLASSDGGATRGISALATHWFSEGIAEFMSCQFLERSGEVRFQPWRSSRVSGTARPPGWRIPCVKALEIPLHGLDLWAELQMKDLDVKKREEALVTISVGFYADMSNFILWLNLKSGADRPRQFEAYAREEMAGRGGLDSFKRCFPKLLDEVKDLDKTIDEFVLHIANGKINPYQESQESNDAAPAAPKK
jgi:hypothetical protein